MRKFKEIERMDLKLESVICDRCEVEMSEDDYFCCGVPYFHLSYVGGYNSEYPGDMEMIECDLCEECLKQLVDKFARKGKATVMGRTRV